MAVSMLLLNLTSCNSQPLTLIVGEIQNYYFFKTIFIGFHNSGVPFSPVPTKYSQIGPLIKYMLAFKML